MDIIILGLLLVLLGFGVFFYVNQQNDKSGGIDPLQLNELKTRNEELEQQLIIVRESASRNEALADERKENIAKLNSDLSKLRERMSEEADEKETLSNEIARLKTRIEDERKTSEEKIQLLTEVREKMESKFRELAQDALKVQGEEFSKSNLEKLSATLAPLKEHVGLFEKELKQLHHGAVSERAALKNQIETLTEKSETLSKDAQELARALKSDQQKQGAWGEMVLQRILENSGLREGAEYEIQVRREGDEGQRLRPDVVVKLTRDKTLVIDSKVSLGAYTESVNAESEEERAEALKRHVRSVLGHIDTLSRKNYQSAEELTVDYVVLFMPFESALSEALNEKPDLTNYALERNIMIATPTTLMMALRTVANVWSVERRNQNAEEIAHRAGRLFDKVSNFLKSMEKVGSRLDQAQSAFRDASSQLSSGHGNVISQVQMLKSLGAKTTKSIDTAYEPDDEVTSVPTEKPGSLGP